MRTTYRAFPGGPPAARAAFRSGFFEADLDAMRASGAERVRELTRNDDSQSKERISLQQEAKAA